MVKITFEAFLRDLEIFEIFEKSLVTGPFKALSGNHKIQRGILKNLKMAILRDPYLRAGELIFRSETSIL